MIFRARYVTFGNDFDEYEFVAGSNKIGHGLLNKHDEADFLLHHCVSLFAFAAIIVPRVVRSLE